MDSLLKAVSDRSFLFVIMAIGGNCCALAGPPAAAGKVEIILWPDCAVLGDVIQISHVARVTADDKAQRELIESLDLAETPQGGSQVDIPVKLIEFRLRLAGIDPARVVFHGSRTSVRRMPVTSRQTADIDPRILSTAASIPSEEATSFPKVRSAPLRSGTAVTSTEGESVEKQILGAARQAVLAELPWEEENISIQPLQPVGREAKWATAPSERTCTAQIRSAGPPVGRVNVDVTVTCRGQSPVVVPVALDVRHFANVVTTARPVARGRKIEQEDLYLHRWDVTGAAGYQTKPDQVVGRVASRALPALQLISDQDLVRVAPEAEVNAAAIVIKRQSRVKMVATIGSLKVTVDGDALQDGRVGETIRVQNVESKLIVKGRVLASGEVEIE